MNRTADRRGVLHWMSRGDGTTTVLLHGFTGTADSFARLVDGACGPVCALHLPGHHPQAPVHDDFASNTGWVCEVLRDAGITRARLVGYSLGARVALSVAASEPSLCDGLVLISGDPGLETEEARRARRVADTAWVELLRGGGVEAFVDAWQALPLWDSQRRLSTTVREAQRRRRLSHDPEGLVGSLETMGLGQMPALGSALGSLEAPVTLIVGALDQKYLDLARAQVRRHPHIAVHVIEGTGHNVVLEAPRAVAALIWPR